MRQSLSIMNNHTKKEKTLVPWNLLKVWCIWWRTECCLVNQMKKWPSRGRWYAPKYVTPGVSAWGHRSSISISIKIRNVSCIMCHVSCKNQIVGRNLRIVAQWWTLCESHLLRLYFGVFQQIFIPQQCTRRAHRNSNNTSSPQVLAWYIQYPHICIQLTFIPQIVGWIYPRTYLYF